MDARILRARAAGLAAALDRAHGLAAPSAARRLVRVYDGGAMPTAPDHFFLGRPVELDGDESEGGAGTPSVDEGSSIPFVALWHAPQPGDLLVISAVGGRWVAEKSGGCRAAVCVRVCGGIPLVGAAVDILDGSTVVASGTTGDGGCAAFELCGRYTVRITVSGTVEYQATRDLAGEVDVILAGFSGVVCCGGYAIPTVLTATDAAGSFPMVYDPNAFSPLWTGGHSVDRQSCTVTTPFNLCVVAQPSNGPVRVCYQMACVAGHTPTFTVQRSWSWVFQPGPLTPIWYQDPTGFTPGQSCITAPPPTCGNPLTDTASFAADPASPAGPFALSGAPAAAPGNATADPIGGGVAISA